MSEGTPFEGTAAWLRHQWSNPSDIFTILLIIGGDVVQVAIAQLCAGPIPYLVPVSFSFGWVTRAVSAMLSAVGDNRLMPKPEIDCFLINAKSRQKRTNHSWVLSRLLRDFDHWRPAHCEIDEIDLLAKLRSDNDRALKKHRDALTRGEKSEAPSDTADIRIGLRVTVWQCISASGRGSGDAIYWIGLLVVVVQLAVASIPWALYDEWFTFFVTSVGTALAYVSAALPQWRYEKVGVRSLAKTDKKDVLLTEGNGAHDVILILGCEGGLDLEALAAPYRDTKAWSTRLASIILAICWIALLVSVAGWQQHTWYILGVGMVGILHNVAVAGMKRQPQAFGIDLQFRKTIVARKVMDALLQLEEAYPRAGHALLDEFFPGGCFPRDELIWEYASRRADMWKKMCKEDSTLYSTEASSTLGRLPPMVRPDSRTDDYDIPTDGLYQIADGSSEPSDIRNVPDGLVKGGTNGHIISIDP